MSEQDILQRLAATIEARRKSDPNVSYVAALNAKGLDAILKKIGEESTEVILAAKGDDRLHVVKETADLWFHCLVMLAWHDLTPDDVIKELLRREGTSGITEKAARIPEGKDNV